MKAEKIVLSFVKYDSLWGRKYFKSERGILYCVTDWNEFFICSPDGEPEYEFDSNNFIFQGE